MLSMKTYEKHSDTKVHIIGPGTIGVPFEIIRDTEQGDRSEDGNTDTIQLGRGNNEECNQGDICKYVNIHLEIMPTSSSDFTTAVIEWAFVKMKASDLRPTKSNLGTNTLGDVMTKYLRNQCIFTGAIPIGQFQASVQEISLKIPKMMWMLKTGDQWLIFFNVRSSVITDTATDSVQLVSSFNYKNYH